MTRKQWMEPVSLAGSVIGLVLNVVAFLAKSTAIALLGGALLVVALVMFVLLYLSARKADAARREADETQDQLNKLPFEILDVEKTLRFEDEEAHKATYVDTRRVRANHRGLTEYWFKELAPIDRIHNILVDDAPPNSEVEELTAKRVSKYFPNGLDRDDEFTTILSFDLIGSFTGACEFYQHRVVDPTQRLRFRATFHPEKLCRDARAKVGHGGGALMPLRDAELRVLHGGRELEFVVLNPVSGQQYYVEWDW